MCAKRLAHCRCIYRRDAWESLKVANIERYDLVDAMSLHGSNEPRIVSVFAEYIVLNYELPPWLEDSPFVANQSELLDDPR